MGAVGSLYRQCQSRQLRTAQGLADGLAADIAIAVRWHDSVAVLIELGCDIFVQVNPANVLSRLGFESFLDGRFFCSKRRLAGMYKPAGKGIYLEAQLKFHIFFTLPRF